VFFFVFLGDGDADADADVPTTYLLLVTKGHGLFFDKRRVFFFLLPSYNARVVMKPMLWVYINLPIY
jgi:hypothetical protein